ncbi:G5 domain-containing protein [Demequina capsici]|uniref:G5 domain-containing protein n=1 Tax=Demequina capsici TaxID=3075620 RepID=A0AA96F7W3_9MICO|nr:G5 domain-containing protein [Demequina sp. OYTSA14]WNM25027.1 G5 domain-containing protein [Demequina sp. OYTSA14]
MRQLGVSAALVAFAAGSFTSTSVDALASVRQSADSTQLDVVGPVDAAAADVEVVTETSRESVPNDTVTESDPSAKKGVETVVDEGSPGTSLVSYEVTYVDGVEVSRKQTVSVVVQEPVDKVVSVGTLEIPTVATTTPGTNQAIGQELAASLYGWTGEQWQCLSSLWSRESGWSTTAANSSGAYGIPQALPGSKMAAYGDDWRTNPTTQIKWGLAYVSGRYGTPCGAWGHFTSVGWY